MGIVPIEEVALDASGNLRVVPAKCDDHMYPFIYRAGNGLRWEGSGRAFVAWEPSRWAHAELLRHIVSTVREECGDALCVTAATTWKNIPDDLELAMRATFG